MKRRIFWSVCTVALGSVLLLCACVVGLVYRQTTRDSWRQLRNEAAYLSAGYDADGIPFLERVSGEAGRVTLVAADGAVLFDDEQDPAAMDNHSGRPEIAAALAGGAGQAQRQSDTMGERQLYYAVRLANGAVLRVSLSAAGVASQAVQMIPWLLLVGALVLVAAVLVARWLTRFIVEPLNGLDLDAPLQTAAYDELAPVLRRLSAQQQQIAGQMAEAKRRAAEFEAITGNMAEGLLVLDPDATVLSINTSARRILEAEAADVPVPMVAVNRSMELDAAAKKALAGSKAEALMELAGRKYRVLASPAGGGGAVLLLLDDTEKLEGEQQRQEFSANVSHELKSPLTSISGYAELIESGMAAPGDVAGFGGRIRREAQRLVELVDDLIKLSRLDEKPASLQREPVDLLGLAQAAAESLSAAAGNKRMTIEVLGASTEISGVRSILAEVLYNLMDNAIRYGQQGGRVRVRVSGTEAGAVAEVADDGPGIPPEHRARVFERFYRVDKSHSKTSGGTGLGLAIVKRGVLYHGGAVALDENPGGGARFVVTLPKAPQADE